MVVIVVSDVIVVIVDGDVIVVIIVFDAMVDFCDQMFEEISKVSNGKTKDLKLKYFVFGGNIENVVSFVKYLIK